MAVNYLITSLENVDSEALVELVNSAYRGEGSKKGWTTEADIIDGNLRIDQQAIHDMLQKPGAVILTCKADNDLYGCVYLNEDGKGLYLGMLSVSPDAQGSGIGKKLLQAAEQHAAKFDYTYIRMTVIDIRHELIAWYERHGYKRTGERKPFPDDEKFGKPTRPIEFIVLEKMISA